METAPRDYTPEPMTPVTYRRIVPFVLSLKRWLMGRDFRITSERGVFFPHRWAKELVATIHPSAILRMPDRYKEEYALFVHDLKRIAAKMKELG